MTQTGYPLWSSTRVLPPLTPAHVEGDEETNTLVTFDRLWKLPFGLEKDRGLKNKDPRTWWRTPKGYGTGEAMLTTEIFTRSDWDPLLD